jgi:hypothetical protein
MGLFRILADLLERSRYEAEEQRPIVVQYGSTKSYTFRREVTRDNFTLPETSDQLAISSILRAVRQFYLPDLTDEDFDNLRQMLILTDDVILSGLKDPSNWVLPRGFSDIPFVKSRLEKGYPIAQIIDMILAGTRLYVWLYRDDESVAELIPHLLELEESYEPMKTRLSSGGSARIRQSVTAEVD